LSALSSRGGERRRGAGGRPCQERRFRQLGLYAVFAQQAGFSKDEILEMIGFAADWNMNIVFSQAPLAGLTGA
jgi:hypothetical protein